MVALSYIGWDPIERASKNPELSFNMVVQALHLLTRGLRHPKLASKLSLKAIEELCLAFACGKCFLLVLLPKRGDIKNYVIIRD